MASGKWQVASGKWQVARFMPNFQYVVNKIKPFFLIILISFASIFASPSSARVNSSTAPINQTTQVCITRNCNQSNEQAETGFTLIELSIVLVIIGLLVGGVLTGRDLIAAAEIRSQISQIEKYNVAVNTFKVKYNAIPGDIPAAQATAFGFSAVPNRVGTQGQGYGNGIIEGIYSAGVGLSSVDHNMLIHGETAWFWADLSVNSNLIDGNFTSASATPTSADSGYVGSNVAKILPLAKLGKNNYISVYQRYNDIYFVASAMYMIDGNGAPNQNTGYIVGSSNLAMTPQQAYSIDSKMDDGLPQSGRVNANYQNWILNGTRLSWASGGGVEGATSSAVATPASATTCYDNGNVAGTQKYSVGQNGGNGLNCALSFKF